jgi:hypothetical protein
MPPFHNLAVVSTAGKSEREGVALREALTFSSGISRGIVAGNLLPVAIGTLNETVSAATPGKNPRRFSAEMESPLLRSFVKPVRAAYSNNVGTNRRMPNSRRRIVYARIFFAFVIEIT